MTYSVACAVWCSPKKQVREVLDVSIGIDIPWDICRDRLIQRKVAGGKSREAAERHVDEVVDAPNYK